MARRTAHRAASCALALVLVAVSALSAGCVRTNAGSETGAGDTARPPGHVVTGVVRTEGASLHGIDVEHVAPDGVRLNVTPWSQDEGSPAFLVFTHAVLPDRGAGLLVVPVDAPLHVEGPVTFRSNEVSLTPRTLRYPVAEAALRVQVDVPEATHERLRAAVGDVDKATSLELALDGAVRVHAERALFAQNESVMNLTGVLHVARADAVAVWGQAVAELAPAPVDAHVAKGRGGLALEHALGHVAVDPATSAETRVPLQGPAGVTLAHGSRVTLTPEDNLVIVAFEDARAFQVYADARAVIPAELVVRWDPEVIEMYPNGSESVALVLVNPDPHTDAVITNASLSDVPDGATMRLPGFRPITSELTGTFGTGPMGALAFAFAMPPLLIMDGLLAFIDGLFGPPPIPQVMNAGSTFTTHVGVGKADDPFTSTFTVDGNFQSERATLEVR